ncbi:MAG: hypothetical protein WCI04_01060 [archaeon]
MAKENPSLTEADFTPKEIKDNKGLFIDQATGVSFQSLLKLEGYTEGSQWFETNRQHQLRKIIYFRERAAKKAENKKKTGRQYCVFCFNACKPSRKYLSHTKLSDCPTLKHTKCGKCGELGHTRKKCRSLEDKNIRTGRRTNRRPEDDYDSDCNYMDGDSEYWTDSSDEEEPDLPQEENVKAAVVETVVIPKKVTTWASIAAKNI